MFSTHVTRKLSAYLHEELSPEENRRLAEHLIGCSRCRLEFEQVKFGVKLAGHLSVMPAPDSLWSEIDAALNKHPNVRAMPPRRARSTTVWAIAASLVILFIGGALLIRSVRNDRQPAWAVARLEGTPRIASKAIGPEGKLRLGQWLETDNSSRAKIDIANIGQVEIDPNTRVRLLETKSTEHRLELARGRMSARISAPPKLFFVNTPSAVAEDLGCAYTLDVDDDGNSLLHVTLGWVSLQLKDRASIVPAGAACMTRAGIGPGTPYFEDASEIFRTALAKLDFEPNDTHWSKIPALDLVLLDARPRDAMTLWYLLTRVDQSARARIYDRMVMLAPPPAGVTRDGILKLDKEMLDRWYDGIIFQEDTPGLIYGGKKND